MRQVFINSLRIHAMCLCHTCTLPPSINNYQIHSFLLYQTFLLFIIHEVQLCSSLIFECIGFSWIMGDLPGSTMLQKTDSPFPQSYQLPKALAQGVGYHSHFPKACVGILFSLSLHRSSACCHNNCEFICASALLYAENTIL